MDTRCSYDRAGAGFSDPGPMPRTSVRIADELRRALHSARIEGSTQPTSNPHGKRRGQLGQADNTRRTSTYRRPLNESRCMDGNAKRARMHRLLGENCYAPGERGSFARETRTDA